jgi:hypothetical protein
MNFKVSVLITLFQVSNIIAFFNSLVREPGHTLKKKFELRLFVRRTKEIAYYSN